MYFRHVIWPIRESISSIYPANPGIGRGNPMRLVTLLQVIERDDPFRSLGILLLSAPVVEVGCADLIEELRKRLASAQ
jgi:hypothetical protein